ncbi:MAG: PEGA domain-containing protein [Ignavibacteria bacterium]|nr:PEGA domain-containing protein [Ignavibacteria bacterium]
MERLQITTKVLENMFNRIRLLSLTLLFLTTLTSCATIMHGTRQSIEIASNPSDAYIWVDRQFIGNTPMIVEMFRKNDHVVRIELEGYQPYELILSRHVSGWALGNIVFGGIIGLAVDAISGGLYILTPEQIQAEMRSNRIAYTKNTKGSFIAVVMEPDPSWEKVGSLVAANYLNETLQKSAL